MQPANRTALPHVDQLTGQLNSTAHYFRANFFEDKLWTLLVLVTAIVCLPECFVGIVLTASECSLCPLSINKYAQFTVPVL